MVEVTLNCDQCTFPPFRNRSAGKKSLILALKLQPLGRNVCSSVSARWSEETPKLHRHYKINSVLGSLKQAVTLRCRKDSTAINSGRTVERMKFVCVAHIAA